jgi:DNA-binding protein YbaB
MKEKLEKLETQLKQTEVTYHQLQGAIQVVKDLMAEKKPEKKK